MTSKTADNVTDNADDAGTEADENTELSNSTDNTNNDEEEEELGVSESVSTPTLNRTRTRTVVPPCSCDPTLGRAFQELGVCNIVDQLTLTDYVL